MSSKDKAYLEQINKFYNRRLRSYQIIEIGDTPEFLQNLGAKALPIVIKQSTLAKCIREPHGSRSAHSLDRKMIEALPDQIRNPIMAVEEKQRNSFALISDYKDKMGNHMLVALKMNATVQNMVVNEVTSFYGRQNLEIYLNKHDPSEIHIIDNNKAKQLASLLGLQLPTTLQALDYSCNLAQSQDKVNSDFQFLGKEKMISMIKTQFEYFTDLEAGKNSFEYMRLGSNTEKLAYLDDYNNEHILYHSIVGGKEICLYRMNNERNKRIELPQQKVSVINKLTENEKLLKQNSRVNNLENQRTQTER